MASSAHIHLNVTPDRAKRWMKYAIGALVTGFIAALFTYAFTAKLNTESALQQQNLAALQEFISTGSKLDASITNLSDTLLDGDDLLAEKKVVREAIAAHASASQSLVQIVGKDNIDAYLVGVGMLRELVDSTGDVNSAMQTSQARFDVMHNRTKIIEEARENIYG